MYSYVFFDGAINFYTSSLEGYIHLPNLSSTISIVNSIEKPCTSPALNALDYSLSDKYNASCFWNNEPYKDVSIYSNTSLIN